MAAFSRLKWWRRATPPAPWWQDAPSAAPTPDAGPDAAADAAPDDERRGDFLLWCFAPCADAAAPASADELDCLDRLDAELARLADDPRAIARPPLVLPRLLAALRHEHADAQDLARLIARDTALVADVLSQANSAYYRRGAAINTLERAVVVLGREGLSRLIAAAALRPLLSPGSGRLSACATPRLWELGNQRASGAAILAHARQLAMFEAYLGGLLLDLGLSTAIRCVDRLVGPLPLPRSLAFYAALSTKGRALGTQMLQLWTLPPAILRAVAEQTDACGPLSALGGVLRDADRAAQRQLLGSEDAQAAVASSA